MCILIGKAARLLKEDNANLKAKVESLTKRAEEAETKLRRNSADSEKEIKERIQEVVNLRNIVSSRDNTIKQLKAEVARYKPNRSQNGRFAKKTNPIGYKKTTDAKV